MDTTERLNLAQGGFPGGASRNLPANTGDNETRGRSLGQEETVEDGLATHFSILAWGIP